MPDDNDIVKKNGVKKGKTTIEINWPIVIFILCIGAGFHPGSRAVLHSLSEVVLHYATEEIKVSKE